MKKQTKIVIVPGFGSNGSDQTYRHLKNIYKKRCFVMSPSWKYKTPKDWVVEYEDYIVKKNLTDFIALGFSLGAYIVACSKIIPKKTIYASISPFFKEDLRSWPANWLKMLGKRRVKNIGRYVSKPNSVFINGSEEVNFALKATKRLSNKNDKVVLLKGVGHDLSDKKYFDTITQLLSKSS